MDRETNIKYLPINLRKKAQRELRKRNGGIGRNRLKNRKRRQKLRKRKMNFECEELKALIKSTEMELTTILQNEPLMLDIPGDITIEELEGEIALAEGRATTVYIERDGLSILKIVLPQEKPTIANLKRAIESKARIQLKRELRERLYDHMHYTAHGTITTTSTKIKSTTTATASIKDVDNKESHVQKCSNQQQQITGFTSTTIVSAEQNKYNNNNNNNDNDNDNSNNKKTVTFNSASEFAGELVCSSTYNGHYHRPTVSWRYLWRAYCLFNLSTKQPIKGEDGRQLLSECDIENGTVLKFCKREKYFGRKRQ